MHVMHAPVPAAAEAAAMHTMRQPLVGWRRCTKNMHDPNVLLDTRSASPREPASIAAVSASSQKRRTSKKPNAKNIEKSCSYRPNENVAFKQYKIQGNASNLVQSDVESPPLQELESGIAPLVPPGFDPACWGLIQLPPSRPGPLIQPYISTKQLSS